LGGAFGTKLDFVAFWAKLKKSLPVEGDYLLGNYFYWGVWIAGGLKGVKRDYPLFHYFFLGFSGR
jgi:hypothetical protein